MKIRKGTYTGYNDKDGNKICVGDIISPPNDKLKYEVCFGEWNNAQSYEDHESGVGLYLKEINQRLCNGNGNMNFTMVTYCSKSYTIIKSYRIS